MDDTTLPENDIQGTEPAIDETVVPGTTEPEAEPAQPDTDALGETPDPPKPSGVEKRFSELVWKAREAERKAAYFQGLAEAGGRGAPEGAEPKAKDGPPKQEQFETYDEYLRALTRHEIGVEMAQERHRLTAEMEHREARGGFEQRAEAFRQKHADFDQVAFNEDLEISGAMRDAILNSQDGAELAYHLGKNPEEASRIARLNPYHQMLELGRISARIAAPPPAPPRPASAAPAPITPVKAVGKAVEGLREDLPIGEWMARRAKELRGRR